MHNKPPHYRSFLIAVSSGTPFVYAFLEISSYFQFISESDYINHADLWFVYLFFCICALVPISYLAFGVYQLRLYWQGKSPDNIPSLISVVKQKIDLRMLVVGLVLFFVAFFVYANFFAY